MVPIFGENGAIIVQYLISLGVILALIVLVVWAIRRFGGGAIGPATRGRLPRLAIVDTLSLDNKRRLVLVRRDNVEHLVLVGGPTDLVVEPSIVRQRVAQRPGQTTPGQATASGRLTQAAAAAPPPPPPPPAPPPRSSAQAASRPTPPRPPAAPVAATEEAIPFPPRRSPLRPSERFSLPRREPARGVMTESVAAASDPLIEPVAARRSAALARQEADAEALEARQLSERFAPVSVAAEPPDGPVPGYPAETRDDQEGVSAFAPSASGGRDSSRERHLESAAEGDGAEPGTDMPGPSPSADSEPAEEAAQQAEVSDLEQEMARLLNQISTSRRE